MIKSARDKVTVGGGVKPSFSVDIFDVSSLLELPKFREQLLSFLETPLFKSVHPLKLFFLVFVQLVLEFLLDSCLISLPKQDPQASGR